MSSRGSSSSKSEDRHTLRVREIQVGCSENKRCFDCRQRGPNYVNVSVGAFVCTKCSGMLRGVTPPMRIKSISMSTFTTEDVSLLESRGNLWCSKVWLATYSQSSDEELASLGDEVLKQHILDKYEKKRYYIDPSTIPNLESFSSAHLRQNSKTPPSLLNNSSPSSLIGSRISQKHSSSPSSTAAVPLTGKGLSRSSNINGGISSLATNITSNGGGISSSLQTGLNGGVSSSESSNLTAAMDPFGAPFVPSGTTSSSTNSGFEAFANFETAHFESPPAGSYSSPTTSPHPPDSHSSSVRSNLNHQHVFTTNSLSSSTPFDANNNPLLTPPVVEPRFDFHFSSRPVLNERFRRALPVYNNPQQPSYFVRPPLPLLTHDSDAVERRKKAKLHLDVKERPWVVFGSSNSSLSPPIPPRLPNRKKYIPIAKSKSSSNANMMMMAPSSANSSSTCSSNPFLFPDINNNNPFLEDVIDINNNHNNNTLPFPNKNEYLSSGLSFFTSLINDLPSYPSVRVVDDSSVTNIADPLNSLRGGNASSSSNATSPEPPVDHFCSASSQQPLARNGGGLVSPPHQKKQQQTSEDRYAALKDLDEIFRSAQISSDNNSSVDSSNHAAGGVNNFLSGNSNSAGMNGSIFGSGAADSTNNLISGSGGGGISSLFESTTSVGSNINQNGGSNADGWKRLSSSDNSGWANFGNSGGSNTPAASTTSNPFNLVGSNNSNNFSQLNTSPWPTTGTSPVQSGGSNAFANSFATDPFSVTNQSFQNPSEILSNDLFANAPKPNGGTKNSNLNNQILSTTTTGESLFASQFLDNALAAAPSNPWDAPPMVAGGTATSPFTDNMMPSFNPKNPFL